MIQIHQVLATLSYGDAIGHEVLGIQDTLIRAGFKSDIFVETADLRLESLTRPYHELPTVSGPDNILIHHFSIASMASRIAFALQDRMILIYHNITPPEYFINIHPLLVQLCYTGRRELTPYAKRCDLALGDSEFNRKELEHLGFEKTGVLSVVPNFTHLDVNPNRVVAGTFDDDWTNILFVGRMIPNKRIEDLIRIFHAYHLQHNPKSRLLLVGSYDGFENYHASLRDLITTLRTPDVHFTGQISDEELTAFYDVADMFLSASEHEGFCVPIVESFYKKIPVLAYAATAVPSTMDGAGILYDTKVPEAVATLMHTILASTDLQDWIILEQEAALNRLQNRDFNGTLLNFVEQVRHAPRLPPHEISPTFWTQFEIIKRLEELRLYRPAAFKALPPEPYRSRESLCSSGIDEETFKGSEPR